MKTAAVYLLALAFVVVFFLLGYRQAVIHHWSACLAGWREAMSYSSHPPPPDDWPGFSECHLRTRQSFGERWAGLTIGEPPPMPEHYRNEDW